jgi:hypothetical protein
VAALCGLHGLAIWTALGGREGLTNGWPLWRHDHPLYFHSALVTRHFLRQTGTTAGYDPSFMSGYAKSVVFPASSTLPELVVACFGGSRPDLAYKVYVLVGAALPPWLVALAGLLWRLRAGGVAAAVLLFLVYIWTDFPINYVAFGMVPYFLGVPLALVATGTFCRYLERGGPAWWTLCAASLSVAFLVHLTTALIFGPAAALAYVAAAARRDCDKPGFPAIRHAGVWALPVVVLAANGFWWLPGVWLASTKGPSDFAFFHPEGVGVRLWQIVTVAPTAEAVLIVAGVAGLLAARRRGRALATGLCGFVAAGFFWGYLAGGLRSLDFLQPGRHTFAFYSGLALAAGLGLAEAQAWFKNRGRQRLGHGVVAGSLLAGVGLFWIELEGSVRYRLSGPQPFLSSRPSPRLLWVVDRVRRHVRPGERLLYEEAGFSSPTLRDPFDGGRFSGLLPWKTGVEVLGGPYLHASLTTNYTQFGEGKLFGKEDWDRDHFVRHARLYRPAAILCWSARARSFCRANPDLVRVLDEAGGMLIGRVEGFGGATIEGVAEVEASPGRLRVRGASGGLDGRVVLRYHSVPCLRAVPPVAWEPVLLDGDPVPFIGLRPPADGVTFELRFPPGWWAGASHASVGAEAPRGTTSMEGVSRAESPDRGRP